MTRDAIAIIPARGGSKRILRKNIKPFFGKPLIAYSIQAALESSIFEKVIVSTDDKEIAEIASDFGAEIPFIRPKSISDDFASLTEVLEHAVNYFEKEGEKYENICTLYATAPLVQVKHLLEGYEALKNSDAVHAFSSALMPFPVQRTFKIDERGRCEMFTPENYYTRSQDLEDAYQDAGQFCWTNRQRQIQYKSRIVFSEISIPVIIPRNLVQDIDTPEDWHQAELLYEAYNNHLKSKT